jgi:hypothetical protein
MNPELEEKLIRLHPWVKPKKMNSDRPYRFECGDGWYQLLDDLCNELEEANASGNTGFRLRPMFVKEKFGMLRVNIWA